MPIEAEDPRTKGYRVVQLDEVEPVYCSCGESRRAFGRPDDGVASLHLVNIDTDARVHYHRTLTEMYYVLEGEGHMELDGDRIAVRPGTAVLIPPGTRHRAIGELRVLVIPVPAYDAEDEFYD